MIRPIIINVCASLAVAISLMPHAVMAQVTEEDERFVVTILGSGSPTLDPARYSQSTLVEAGDAKLLFDTGRGATLRLAQAGLRPAQVTDVFFTHYHSDHTVGFPDFWLTSWINAGGSRTIPINVTGPTGVVNLTEGLKLAYADDIRIRIDDQQLPPEGVALNVTEFEVGGIVYDKDGLVVTAFEVDHGDKIKPSFGYRIDYNGRSVVLSSDTKKSDIVIEQARGADLLIHEVAMASDTVAENPPIKLIMAHHTSSQEAGEVFAAAKPKLAVYSHYAFLWKVGAEPKPSAEDIVEATRETYDGPLVAGEDLMTFTIGEEVIVGRAGSEE